MVFRVKQWRTASLYRAVLLVWCLSVLFYIHQLIPGSTNGIQKRAETLDKLVERENNIINSKGENTTLNSKEENRFVRVLGPGEGGERIDLNNLNLTVVEQERVDRLVEQHGFDAALSDQISVHRKLPDIRPAECLAINYGDLPAASVVVPFRDEHLSILLRTIYSILEITPPKLLTELILVDDGSTDGTLRSWLRIHVASLEKVKVIRSEETRGLMLARQSGIDAATSELVVVMDSHMEVFPGWLEPLIARLLENPKAILCGNVGIISRDDFSVHHWEKGVYKTMPFFEPTLGQTGAAYKQEYVRGRNKATDPLKFATLSGMMMAFNKTVFNQLGGYDPGMKVWGGEQMEISLKYWMCGGVIELMPCCYVAHMFRSRVIWKNNAYLDNLLRVALVWMDEYKKWLYEYYPGIEKIDPGDLEDRKRIRRENNCKSFQYFLDEMDKFVIYDLPVKRRAKWPLSSKLNPKLCVDAGGIHHELILYYCHSGQNQLIELSESRHIRHYSNCARLEEKNNKSLLIMNRHRNLLQPQCDQWRYTDKDTIVHDGTGKCLTADVAAISLSLQPCDDTPSQEWNWNRETTPNGRD